MRAALIGAVDFNAGFFRAHSYDFVVAVDGGFATCQEVGIAPDVALGDFDSLGYVPEGLAVQQHSPIKDQSDMELALQAVAGQGAAQVHVFGALAGRLDHTLANLQLFAAYARRGMQLVGIGSDFACVFLASQGCARLEFDAFDPSQLSGAYAPFVSVFAIGGSAAGVTESGFKYVLDEGVLSALDSLGLSNEFTGDAASISVAEGALAVFMPLEGLSFAHFA